MTSAALTLGSLAALGFTLIAVVISAQTTAIRQDAHDGGVRAE